MYVCSHAMELGNDMLLGTSFTLVSMHGYQSPIGHYFNFLCISRVGCITVECEI